MHAGETFDFEHEGKQFRAYVESDDCGDALRSARTALVALKTALKD